MDAPDYFGPMVRIASWGDLSEYILLRGLSHMALVYRRRESGIGFNIEGTS
jgi:hypothetical protein